MVRSVRLAPSSWLFLLLPWADRRSGHGLRRQSRCRQSSAASCSILTNRALQRPACSLPLAASPRGFGLCSQHAPGDSFLYLSRFRPEDRNCSRYFRWQGIYRSDLEAYRTTICAPAMVVVAANPGGRAVGFQKLKEREPQEPAAGPPGLVWDLGRWFSGACSPGRRPGPGLPLL